ncbi:MAG TPA: hypothetical protein VK530_00270 [Candidatus Acidoferrum sp.]|nr:hypothetical protein [Candidatus Acidoferrum sp.]
MNPSLTLLALALSSTGVYVQGLVLFNICVNADAEGHWLMRQCFSMHRADHKFR